MRRFNAADWFGIQDLVEHPAIGESRGFWSRVLASDELRAGLGFDEEIKKYPVRFLPFFVWFVAEKHGARKKFVAPSTALDMFRVWQQEEGGVLPAVALPGVGEGENGAGAISRKREREPVAVRSVVEHADTAYPVAEQPDMGAALVRVADALERRELAADTELLTVEEVAARVHKSAGWVRKNIPSISLGRTRLWRPSDLARFIAGQRAG